MNENYQRYLELIENFYQSKNNYLGNKDKHSKCDGCETNIQFVESQKEIILNCGDTGKCGKKIEIIFRSPVRLIKVTIWKVISNEHRSMFKNLFNAVETQKIYLKNNFINEESTYHSIELPSVGVGAYDVKWRAISQDGHIIKGKFSINVLGK